MPPKKNSSQNADAEMEEAKPQETANDVEMKPVETPEPAKPAEPVEPEGDLPAPKSSIKETVCINDSDCTLDVIRSDSKLLTAFSGGGFQNLVSGARSNFGIKSGRYVFEVRIIEYQSAQSRPPHQVRIGFSIANSTLFLGGDSSDFCIDSEGSVLHDGKRTNLGSKFGKDDTIAMVLNLAAGSPCENTISVFKNGKRVGKDPFPIPEGLKGKALYPTITFKNVSMIVNFGPILLCSLPFNGTPLQLADKSHVEKSSASASKDGKYEVLFPLGLPDEGVFDWLDHFLEKNPEYVELSDRSILNWAKESGIAKKGNTPSKDKPGLSFGIPSMDDSSIPKLLGSLAPVLQKNFVVMELASNLTKAGRAQQLAKFTAPQFKKVGAVVMGEPPAELVAWNQAKVLAEKQKAADTKWKAEKEEKRKKKQADAQRTHAKAKQEISVKRAHRMKEKREAHAKALKEAKEMGIEKPDNLPSISLTPEEEAEFKFPELVKVELTDEEAGERPKVELTEEEKQVKLSQSDIPDMSVAAVSKLFADFSLPDKSEGFDEVRFLWAKAGAAEPHLKDWVLQKKLSQPVEGIKPGEFFEKKKKEWFELTSPLRKRQQEFKTKGKVVIPAPAKKEGEEDPPPKEVNEEDPEEIALGPIEDINDVNGKGYPAYALFALEDWELMNLRFELHLLVHAFKHDVNDLDRPGVTSEHFAHYYSSYYKKNFNLKAYGCSELKDLIKHVKDCILISGKHNALESKHGEDTPLIHFIKATEENRRERQRRVDAGDETAQIKFSPALANQPRQPAQPPARPQVPSARPPVPRPSPTPRPTGAAPYGGAAPGGGPRWKSYAQATAEKRGLTGGTQPPAARPRLA
eukprot:gnl/MRDRNA2_/MRDRNA2_95445_c0_seq1.p1 gnl/MRDRNA2_/MRDRNA2_95445_c0~~gnl/MRDRNA2_/MRDRNA2_95445_c0_seq1.p1  ORF type:complete len:893 (+),score=243.52 gnl/MRDRNA2_/MRDRNA2_95445_c0_seq1:103-2679(+)